MRLENRETHDLNISQPICAADQNAIDTDLQRLSQNKGLQGCSKTLLPSCTEIRKKLMARIPTTKINRIYRDVEREVPSSHTSGRDKVEENMEVHDRNSESIQLPAGEQGFTNIHRILLGIEDRLGKRLQALENGQKDIWKDLDSKIDRTKDVPNGFFTSIPDNNFDVSHNPVMSGSVPKRKRKTENMAPYLDVVLMVQRSNAT